MHRHQKNSHDQTFGLRLLKKSRKGIFNIIFSRVGIVLFLLLFNAGLLFAFFYWFSEFLPHYYGAGTVFTLCMVIYLINSRLDPTVKITWLAIMMVLPVFGALLYLFTCTELGHRTMRKRLQKVYALSQNSPLPTHTISTEDVEDGVSAMGQYVSHITGIPLCANTEVKYFANGETMLESMLEILQSAEKSIYLEYFIIEEGVMWGKILEVLMQKAQEGVDVRVLYDGTCEFALLPMDYPKKLKALGIKCRVFAPVTPFVSTHYNYRDHRKILTVDGHVAFTGGVNLADEYINLKRKFGYWKDAAVLVRGDAAKAFERMFLQLWNLEEKEPVFSSTEEITVHASQNDGFVLPYYEDPLDNEHVGRQVYIDILSRAKQYVHIMTPYLILDGELESALKYAAKRGVDVAILLPGVPDKQMPYALAKGHYSALVAAGVKIYEYAPGFVHAKVMVADDKEAVVGTVNLDYRSLYHHFECALYCYQTSCISDIEADFRQCVCVSKQITPATIQSEKLYYKVLGKLLKIIAPLL